MQIKIHSADKTGLRYRIACVSILLLSLIWCGAFMSVPFLSEGSLILRKTAGLIRLFFAPVCHQSDVRSYHLAGHSLPVCARCTGIYCGFLTGILITILATRMKTVWIPPRSILLIGMAITGLEVLLSNLHVFASTLLSRCITGTVLGFIASFFVMAAVYQIIDHQKKHEVKTWKELPVN
jgi:uncharacterized membrane protein